MTTVELGLGISANPGLLSVRVDTLSKPVINLGLGFCTVSEERQQRGNGGIAGAGAGGGGTGFPGATGRDRLRYRG